MILRQRHQFYGRSRLLYKPFQLELKTFKNHNYNYDYNHSDYKAKRKYPANDFKNYLSTLNYNGKERSRSYITTTTRKHENEKNAYDNSQDQPNRGLIEEDTHNQPLVLPPYMMWYDVEYDYSQNRKTESKRKNIKGK